MRIVDVVIYRTTVFALALGLAIPLPRPLSTLLAPAQVAMPGPAGAASAGAGPPLLSDVLGKSRSAAMFSGLARETSAVDAVLDDGAGNTTVLAPTDDALRRLDRKPWADAGEVAQLGGGDRATAYAGADGEQRARRNLARFVEAHVVPVRPWREGAKARSLAGAELWWEARDGKRVVSCTRWAAGGLRRY